MNPRCIDKTFSIGVRSRSDLWHRPWDPSITLEAWVVPQACTHPKHLELVALDLQDGHVIVLGC